TRLTVTEGPFTLNVLANTHTHYVKLGVFEYYDANQQTIVQQDIVINSAQNMILIQAATEIRLQCGESLLSLKADGTIELSGVNVTVSGDNTVNIGVGNQGTTYNKSKVETHGAGISSCA